MTSPTNTDVARSADGHPSRSASSDRSLPGPSPSTPVAGRLSRADRLLPLSILAAMAGGLALGRFVPGIAVLGRAVLTIGERLASLVPNA